MIQRTYSLTFSRRNQHIKRLIEDKKAKGEIITDYVCKAIEFYEKFKDTNFLNQNINANVLDSNYVTRDEVESLINRGIEDFFSGTLNRRKQTNSFITTTPVDKIKDEPITVLLQDDDKINHLESNLNNINIKED